MSESEKQTPSSSAHAVHGDIAPTVSLHPNITASVTAVVEIREEGLPISFGRFELRAVVGRGGFGTVFRAYDKQLDRDVAVKIPRRGAFETTDQVNRFLREARSGGKLSHPNICPIHDAGEFQGNHYIVMGFIQGTPLSKFTGSGKPMDTRAAARILLKLTAALAEAHDLGIVHRDLKPSNIMIDDKRREPVILDFGLARSFLRDSSETQSGVIVGTPNYMSPEQARGAAAEVGPKSDVYSLGVILYELLTGRPPFSGSTPEVFAQILMSDPEPPTQSQPQLDADIVGICLKAMAREPKQRFASMRDFGKALKGYLQGSPTSGQSDLALAPPAVPAPAAVPPKPVVGVKPVVPESAPDSTKIEFACPHCQWPVRTPLATAGKKGKCPNCGEIVPIPVRVPIASPSSPVPAKPAEPTRTAAESADRIEFPCPHCQSLVRTPVAAAGKKGKCPSCGRIVHIPNVRKE